MIVYTEWHYKHEHPGFNHFTLILPHVYTATSPSVSPIHQPMDLPSLKIPECPTDRNYKTQFWFAQCETI